MENVARARFQAELREAIIYGPKILGDLLKEYERLTTEDIKINEAPKMSCWCGTCRPLTMNDMRFIVCPDCGNKRCPKANDHNNACTNSNLPGQAGSAY